MPSHRSTRCILVGESTICNWADVYDGRLYIYGKSRLAYSRANGGHLKISRWSTGRSRSTITALLCTSAPLNIEWFLSSDITSATYNREKNSTSPTSQSVIRRQRTTAHPGQQRGDSVENTVRNGCVASSLTNNMF
ncbi:hypothetical protein TNCV_1844101 [Trichonephila clavipes]|nr:hypothetical protein TNCV_1844101 [Trichonephila clavipes]